MAESVGREWLEGESTEREAGRCERMEEERRRWDGRYGFCIKPSAVCILRKYATPGLLPLAFL